MASAQLSSTEVKDGKYSWLKGNEDEECKLYADSKYPHRDSLDHPIKHSGAMCATFVPASIIVPPLLIGLYYSCKYWREYKFQRSGHYRNWNESFASYSGSIMSNHLKYKVLPVYADIFAACKCG